MGIAQITPPPLCQMGKYGKKKYSKPFWQALTPPGKRGKKVGLTILASLYTHTPFQAMPMETTHFKGLLLASIMMTNIVCKLPSKSTCF